jgi:hypothetical protein
MHNAPMTIIETQDRAYRPAVYWTLLAAAAIVGAFLRLYLIGDQVLIDDEWHGFYYVIGKSFGYLLTHFSIPGATCTPLHLYYHFLLKTVGWNELLLRLPSIVAGLLCLVVFPLLLRGILSRRATVIFSFLLAISPFLIFYSRFARPYSPEVLFSFITVISAYRWATSGQCRDAVLCVICGAATVYFHLFGIVAVAAPYFCVLLLRLMQNKLPALTGGTRVKLSVPHILAVLTITAGLICILVLPAFVHSAHTSLNTVAGAGDASRVSLWPIIEMMAGTANYVLVSVVVVLLTAGIAVLARKNGLLAAMFGLTVAGFVLSLALSKPHSMHAAIVICRYCIPVFPMAFVLIAVGLDSALNYVESTAPAASRLRYRVMCNALVGAFIVGLLWTGPLRQTYAMPNNFTGHSVFQQSYRPVDWKTSFFSEMTPPGFQWNTTIDMTEISPFYNRLRCDTGVNAIVEFPMMVGDHFNPYYYYQHFHGKRVIIGYTTAFPDRTGLAAGNVFGNTYIDSVLSLVQDNAKLRFKNMINMDDTAALAASGTDYVIIHRKFEAELPLIVRPHPSIPQLEQRFGTAFGPPLFEDDHVIVFRLR